MMLRVFLWILVNTLVFCRYAAAQDNNVYTSYGVDDGLPQSSIWKIVQDQQGFLWLGTSDGVCRFDGYKFTDYRTVSSGISTSGATYNKLYSDCSNGLWVVSQDGICFYDDLKDKFIPVFSCQVRFDHYNSVFGEDAQYIFAGISDYGIIKINKRTHEVIRIKNEALSHVSSWLSAILCGEEIWVMGAIAGSYVYNLKTAQLTALAPSRLTASVNYKDSEILGASETGIFLFKKKDHSYRKMPIVFEKKDITGILILPGAEIMLAGLDGIYYIDSRNWKIDRHVQSFIPGRQRSFAYVQCLYKDRSDNIWIGTNGDGLKKLTAPNKKFKHYYVPDAENNLVKAIYADKQNLYVGYFHHGFDIFSRSSGFIRSVSIAMGGQKNVSVHAITALDSTTLILQSGLQVPLALYHAQKTKEIVFVSDDSLHLKLLGGTNPFFLTAGDTIYTNMLNHYLVSLVATSRHSVKMLSRRYLDNEMLTSGYMERDGTMWIGTTGDALFIKDNIVHKLDILERIFVKSINQDGDGNIWIATTNGIYVVGRDKKILHHYTENNGLVNHFVYGILRDNGGNMWFSHNKGLSVYRRVQKDFRHYTHEDGLQSNEFNTGAYFKAADGELFFGGINGVTSFYPSDIKDNPTIPTAKMTNITLFDVPLKSDTSYWNMHTLTLPYTQNSLGFEFTALEFTNPTRNQYAYMMEGIDNNWTITTDRHSRYPVLPPGHYVFKVKASNNDGIWQTQPTIITINIIAPFWQRVWFRILAVLLFIAVISGGVTWLQRQRRRRVMRAMELQQKIQQERERISRDLHDTVGTQLSLISNNIGWVRRPLLELSEDEKSEKLHFVDNTARDIIATLRETIWALNKQNITYQEFSDKFKGFVQKQLTIYPEIRPNYKEELGDDIVLGPSEALNLFRICQEALANALKYAGASVIDMRLYNAAGKYKVIIADNGKGFNLDLVDPAIQNGLENMRFRARDISSDLVIDSELGRGTTVTIEKK